MPAVDIGAPATQPSTTASFATSGTAPAPTPAPAPASKPAPAASSGDVDMVDAGAMPPLVSVRADSAAAGAGGVAVGGAAGSAEAAVPSGAASAAGGAASTAASGDDKASGVQANKSRCWNCRKKVGLTGFECRCGYTFCAAHRYGDQHSCSFDFKAADLAVLHKAHQKVVASKVDKI